MGSDHQGGATSLETLVEALRADLALATENAYTTNCEGCGAVILTHEDACHHGDVVGCWPYVTGDKAPGPCWRYRTAEGIDRAWPACALAPGAAEPTRKEPLQVAAPPEPALLRVGAALRSLSSSRRDLDRMGEAIRALPGSPVVGRAIGDG